MKKKFSLDSVNFDNTELTTLDAVIIAPSGGGKSHCIGTLHGTVLYLYGEDESHGAVSAAGKKAEIKALSWSKDPETGAPLKADESLSLLSCLLTPDFIKNNGITAIALDSLSSLEKLIRCTGRFKAGCLTKDGVHNAYAEPSQCLKIMDEIFNQVRSLKTVVPVDFIVTCVADCLEVNENGSYRKIKPKLGSYSLAESCIQQFAHILLVGPKK